MPHCSRRAYDHRIRQQIIGAGDPGLFPELDIPRATALSWIHRGRREIVSLDGDDGGEVTVRARMAGLERRIVMLTAVLRLVLALLRASGFTLECARVPDAAGKRRLLGAVERARRALPLSAALRVLVEPLSWLLPRSAAGSLRNPARTRLERRREIDEMKVVIAALIRWARGVAGRIAERVDAALRTTTRPVSLVGGLLRDLTRSPDELLAENMALRQQLIVVARTVKKPRFAAHERGLLVLLAHFVPRWRDAMLLVKPDTVLRWHREGFRLFWRAKSKPPAISASRVSPETVELIRRLAVENRLWGAERIRGELLKLGVNVAKRTIQKHMRRVRGPRPWGQSWSTFLRNHMHQTWACDFLQVYDIWFQPIFAFFIIDLGARKVVHVGVTRNPSTTWVAQQLRNATPYGEGPRFLIRDNDDKFDVDFDRAAKGAGVRVLRTAVRAPLMNSFCERFLGSARRECLDHVVVLGERHLERVLNEYCFQYFNQARPRQGIGQLIPIGSATPASGDAEVVAFPVLNGLHHDYRRAA